MFRQSPELMAALREARAPSATLAASSRVMSRRFSPEVALASVGRPGSAVTVSLLIPQV